MSGFKPVGTEVLFANFGAATVSSVSASAVTITAGYPAIEVPPGYFDKGGASPWSSSLKFKMGGLLIATATVPTFNFSLFAAVQTTSAPAFATTITVVSTGALTAPSATTGATFDIDLEIGLRTPALGAASTLVGWGKIHCSALNAAGFAPFPANAATYSPTATTIDITQGYVLWPGITLGAATAGNTITTEYAKLYGEN